MPRSAPIWRPRTPTEGRARAHRAAAGEAVRRDEGPHQGGRLLGAEPGRRPMPITPATAKAGSTRSSAGSRAAAAPSRCCSTATRSRPARPSSSSAPRGIRPTIGCSPGRPTTRARSTTHCACAISQPARDLADIIPDIEGSPVWTADSSAFYYVRLDANHRPSRVYRHRLGTPAADDVLVYEEKDSAISSRSERRSPAASPKSRSTITRPRSPG